MVILNDLDFIGTLRKPEKHIRYVWAKNRTKNQFALKLKSYLSRYIVHIFL